MGYYTDFTVEATSKSRAAAEAAASELAEMSGYSADMTGHNTFEIHEAKWYDWEKHAQMVSKNHPGAIFQIDGFGEESGDIWRAWAHAGEVYKSEAEMTFPEPKWLPQARSDAEAIVSAMTKAEKQAAMDAELAELARLKAKYEDA